MPGGRLTGEDRRHIAAWLAEGLGYTEIGRRLGRPASTVMREVTRNGGPEQYGAERAQEATRERARRRGQARPQTAPDGDGDGGGGGGDGGGGDGRGSGPGRDPRAVRDFTESFTALLAQQGMPPMVSRVLACLYVTDTGALTAAELVQRLHVSPASVSHAVAWLEQQGMIRRERTAGERRERYAVDDELWLRSLLAAAQMNDALVAVSRRGAEVLGPGTAAGARFEASVELLSLVNESLRQAMEQWRRRLAGRDAAGGA
ncbi:helix-turn-helix domain-containing protein [Streptomyces sp. NPDC048352]|uniref:GbsR/MarR family transcriptional regulator n=1 Tax=Streptomyces sp. NPDC048352 TaxID=3154718 RepID=UPI00342D0DFA